ncbi:MAG TPA: MIP family channel protein [Solirubrobacterales bacterium]|nr:MIP family channel protein [Solirubrobacterales bacterium]
MADGPAGAPASGWNAVMGSKAAWRRTQWGELLSEFLGTFVLVMFGTGVVAMYVAALPQSGRGAGITTDADWMLVTWGWGMAVVMGVYVAGGISGAHINPAVTIALALARGFPWRKVPGYIGAQVLGAFVGAAIVYLNYKDAIFASEDAANAGHHSAGTVGVFVTNPAPYFDTYWGPVISEITGTALLIIIVFAVIDLMNIPPKGNLGPLIIGLGVFAIGMSFGANSGYAINPARDFGPRVFTLFAGWGDAAFPGDVGGPLMAYWWVPIVAPIIGGAVGAVVYNFFIHDVLEARSAPETPGLTRRGEVAEEDDLP